MGRKTIQGVCQICGGQARKINYSSKAKGKVYHYIKYVHSNGVTHYFRQSKEESTSPSSLPDYSVSTFDALEEIMEVRMRKMELRIGQIKRLLEESYGRPVGTATIYRNINKLLKLGLVSKRVYRGAVLYSRKSEDSSTQDVNVVRMSLGFDFLQDRALATVYAHVINMSLRLTTNIPISLPLGPIESLEQIGLIVFNETKRVLLSDFNIAYSYPGRTTISISPNRPLRKSEEQYFFLSYGYNFGESPIKINMLSDVESLKVNCEIPKGSDVTVKRVFVDGLKEIEPMIIKRAATETGHIIVEALFDNASRGDTIIISLSR